MFDGFIKLPRSLLQDPLWKGLSYTYRHVFLTILANVAFKETTQDDFGVLTLIRPGQFLTTERELAKLCDEPDIDKSLVHRCFLKLEKLGFSNQRTNHKKTLITITRMDICDLIEPNFEPNSNQTRTKLEPQKKKAKKEENVKEEQQPLSIQNGFHAKETAVVGFYQCLKEESRLTPADKECLMKFSEERVKLSIEYEKTDPFRDSLIACLRWHCQETIPPPPKVKKVDFWTSVKQYFKNYEKYNQAICYIDQDGITFERGMTHLSVKYREPNAKENFNKHLKQFDIQWNGVKT